jgi:GTP-binding protein HflX
VAVSARTGAGLEELKRVVSDCLGRGFRDVDVETDPGNGRLLAWLGAHGEVLSRHFADDRVTVHCRIPAALLGRIPPAEAVVRPHGPPDRLPESHAFPVAAPHDTHDTHDTHDHTHPSTANA